MNYIKVYEDIIKYYPIGISSYDPRYLEYSGIISLQNKCYEKLDSLAYNKWKALVKEAKKEIVGSLNLDSESPLFYPCYSGSLLLYKEKKGSMLFKRTIVFHISVIAPYFTIYGLDNISIAHNNMLPIEFDPILYASPIDIYEESFKLIQKKIEDQYDGYRFISQNTLGKRITSLEVAGANVNEGQSSSIFQALFTFDNVTNYKWIGDPWYE